MTKPTNETLIDAELQKARDPAKAEVQPTVETECEPGDEPIWPCQGFSIGEF